jgi:ABC-type uncharacterized transport system involved in gliding motility auxiliary subunit
MKGGNVAFLINKVVPNFQQQMVIGDVIKNNLDDMLSSYGIYIENNLIRDAQCATVQVQSAIGFPVSINYPYFANITNVNKDISAFKNIQAVVLSFVSSLDLSVANGKGLKITPLFTTSDKSGKADGFFILNVEQFQNLKKSTFDSLFSNKGYVVGAVFEGNYNSFYTGKPVPQDTTQGSIPYTEAFIPTSTKSSKIIAIGDADFINEEQQRLQKDNILFFVNMVDYLVDDVGLAQIRSKDTSEAPIEEVSDSTKKLIKYTNLILPPVVVLLIGLFIWNRRKAKKKLLQNK